MDKSVTLFFASVLAAALALGEWMAIFVLSSPGSLQSTSDWLIATLIGGPCLAFLMIIPLGIVGTLVAMVKFRR